ncbi:MAG: hypothetical protein RLY14_3216 [Planctomycetota bacterium]|jgi:hypothetical protein
MAKWEYKIVHLRINQRRVKSAGFIAPDIVYDLKDGSESELARLGDEGWELVSTLPIDAPSIFGLSGGTRYSIAFFKRPKS